jgi:hypothetical protein
MRMEGLHKLTLFLNFYSQNSDYQIIINYLTKSTAIINLRVKSMLF